MLPPFIEVFVPKIVNLFAPDYDPYTGYGQKALYLVEHLSAMGYYVNALGGDSLKANERLSPEITALLSKPIIPSVGGIVMGYPTMIEDYGSMLTAGPFIVQTMFESDVLPEGWADSLNCAAAVSVPSRWLIAVMRDSGVTVPISLNPESISPAFHYVARPAYPKVFTFLALGDRGGRKGWDLAVRAFSLAFGDDPRYRLIIKSRAKNTFLTDIFSNPNIEILQADYDQAEMQALYARVHAYLFPTRGEGYGMTPREAAATGLPALCTHWGGTADDLEQWGIPLKYQMVDAWVNDTHQGCGQWAEVDVEYLAGLMQYTASYESHLYWHDRFGRSRLVSDAIHQLYSWEKFAAGLAQLWEQVQEQEYAHARH